MLAESKPCSSSIERRAWHERALDAVQQSVAEVVGTGLSPVRALALAIACAMREPRDVVEFMFDARTAKMALARASDVALSLDGWRALFAADASSSSSSESPLAATKADGTRCDTAAFSDFDRAMDPTTRALRCTLVEREPGRVYARLSSKVACYVGMHLEAPEECVRAVLTTVVASDRRRLEEVQCALDESGPYIVLMDASIAALAHRAYAAGG